MMMKKNVLIMAHLPSIINRDKAFEALLLERGYIVDRAYVPLNDPEAIKKAVYGYEIAACADEYWGEDVLNFLKGSLKMVCRLGSGVDNIDIAAATKAGVAVTNTIGSNATAVAEMAVAYILALTRGVIRTDRHVRRGEWGGYRGNELSSLTVGLVGSGNIGRNVVSMLKGFGCRVIIYDLFHDDVWAEKNGVRYVSLGELLGTSDVISLHVPLTEKTFHMVDAAFLAGMKRTAFLVNTSRGRVVCEKDLYTALKENVISGAALDVFEDEPTPGDNPLLTLDNVIAGSHCGAASFQTLEKNAVMATQNIEDFYNGVDTRYVVNPDYKKYVYSLV
jgi:phosphoglycerate dehydrogenase-like enzyme